jgi:hypothetical protein
MSIRFVEFKTATTKKDPILVNPDHVRTAQAVSDNTCVRLVMSGDQGGYAVNVEGDLKSVWEKLTEKRREAPTPPPPATSVYGR